MANGELTTSVAVDESSHHNPYDTVLIAKKNSDEYILSGKKNFVIDGTSSDLLIVLARTSGKKGDLTGLSTMTMSSLIKIFQ